MVEVIKKEATHDPMATIGHNRSPFDIVKERIEDLYEEAKLWLDGAKVETQEDADAINTLKSRIKDAAKDAEDERVKEIKPLQDQTKAIQDRYNELIGKNKSITGIAIKAEDACNDALRPFLLELKRKQDEEARIAREEAERKHREAMEAMQAREAGNLQSYEDAERLVHEAKQAEKDARAADKVKAHAKGDGRATGLRTVWVATMTDEKTAAAWVWTAHRAELMAFAQSLADKAVRAGARDVPGFNVHDEQVL